MKKTSYSLVLLLTLYLAQGLPVGFMTQALPAILREYDVSLKNIGWTGLLLAPWALKFLWAPIVDKYYYKKIGQSRSWILPLQLLSALLLMVVAFINPENLSQSRTLQALFLVLFMLNLFGATHDIASDALTTRTLDKDSYSTGSSIQVVGYRLGLILGGGVFLMLIDFIGWQISFFGLAGLILLNTLPIMFHKEPDWQSQQKDDVILKQKPTGHNWLKQQFGYFWQSREMRAWLLVLVTFKICDGLSSGMVKPMMTDMGVSLKDIGFWGSVIGSVASLLGAALAAWLMKRISRFTALFVFNLLQVATTAGYALLAYWYEHGIQFDVWLIFVANAVEHAMAAMALVAMLSTVMAYARKSEAGSDFTFQVCMLAFFSGNAHIISGFIAESIGYTGLFVISVVVGIVLLLPLYTWKRIQTVDASI